MFQSLGDWDIQRGYRAAFRTFPLRIGKSARIHEAFHSLRLPSLCFVLIKIMWNYASSERSKLYSGRKPSTTAFCNSVNISKMMQGFQYISPCLFSLWCTIKYTLWQKMRPSLSHKQLPFSFTPLAFFFCSPWDQWIFNTYEGLTPFCLLPVLISLLPLLDCLGSCFFLKIISKWEAEYPLHSEKLEGLILEAVSHTGKIMPQAKNHSLELTLKCI